jgi:hypothetical protein
MIRGHEGVDIGFAICIWITQCTSAPGQRFQSNMPNHDDVSEHAPTPAIAIRKGMYRHDSILKADRDLIRRSLAWSRSVYFKHIRARNFGMSFPIRYLKMDFKLL